jgi:hypothetical protein
MEKRALQTTVLLAMLSLFTHLFLLGGKSLWVDEAYAAGLMNLPPARVVELSSVSTPHPPGGFLLMRASAALAGRGAAGVRLLTALLAASGVIPAYLLATRFLGCRICSFWAAMVWALSPYSVALGQEAWVYGPAAALAFWFLFLSTDPSNPGKLAAWFLTGTAGLYTQFSFILAVVSGATLAALTGRLTRTARWALAGMIILWAPLVYRHSQDFRDRTARLRSGGVTLETAPSRLVGQAPFVLAGLSFDGLAPGKWSTDDPWSAAALAGGLGTGILFLASLAGDRATPGKLRAWALATAALPLVMFATDAPGDRQMYLSAAPLILGAGAAVRRCRALIWAFIPITAVMLCYWYTLETGAWHRSDWRGAASFVTERMEPGDAVMVYSGQSGGVAWDLSGGIPGRLALGGDQDPWSPGRTSSDPAAAADSILAGDARLWLVMDLWGDPPLPREHAPVEVHSFGRDMKVFLFAP